MKKLLSPLIALTFTYSVGAQDQTDYERRMHDIYRSSYSQEVSDSDWEQFISKLSQRSYVVGEGDTLWGLSKIFFGDGFFWSKIWSYNSKLTNPHLIRVGQKIDFFTGSVDQAPSMNIAGTGIETVSQEEVNIPQGFKVVELPNQQKVLVKEGEGMESIDAPRPDIQVTGLYPGAPSIPAPLFQSKPVLENLPATFSEDIAYNAAQYNDRGMSFDIRPPIRVNPLYVARQFLFDGHAQDYPRVGRLLESENKALIVGLNQQVYIRGEQKLQVGERLTVMGREYRFSRNSVDGEVIAYQGTVEITDQIEGDLYRGLIVRSLGGIKGNPWVTREEIPNFGDDYAGRPAEIKLLIIGGGEDNSSRIYGQSDVVFLKGGANQGLRVGDILGVYKNREIRYRNSAVEMSPTPIGHMKVFHVEPNVASAFVINSLEPILPGDSTGPPTHVEMVTTASEKKDLNDIESDLDLETTSASDGSDSSTEIQ